MLLASGLTKSYGGVRALRDGRIRLDAGEIHALVGENGAGKSTMVKILSGVIRRDGGTLEIGGRREDWGSPRDAAAAGIAIVSQELSIFGDLSVAENLFAADLPVRAGLLDLRAMAERAGPVLAQLGLAVPLHERAGDLPLADQQLLEIARALLADPRVLILDEPTSALPAAAASRLEEVLHAVVARGIAVLYISHHLDEVRRIADRVSVLRDGEVVLEGEPTSEVSLDRLVAAMLGDAARTAPAGAAPGGSAGPRGAPSAGSGTAGPGAAGSGEVPGDRLPRLRLDGVSVGNALLDVDLRVAPGEIVGVAGLEGSGHLHVLELVCGLVRPTTGRVVLPDGGSPRSIRGAVTSGVAFVPGDRKRLGLMLDKAVWENVSAVRWLAQGREGVMVRPSVLKERARRGLAQMRFTGDIEAPAGSLSGGNQQKVVFAKWLDADPTVFVLDDPTRGVDIGARAEMHELVREIAARGKVVLISSTDLAELTELCHRVVVFRHGRVVAELTDDLGERALSVAMNAGFVPQQATGEHDG